MTIPGVGGRPRKWRSDADRQKAWRARQAGVAEPPTLTQAVDDGDQLAGAIGRTVALQETIAAQAAEIAALRLALRAVEENLRDERQRWQWLEAENAALRTERDRTLVTSADTAPSRESKNDPHPRGAQPAALSRADRRRLAREGRRRGRKSK